MVVYCSSGGGRAAEEIGSDDVSYHDIGTKKLGFKEPVHHIVRDQDDNIHDIWRMMLYVHHIVNHWSHNAEEQMTTFLTYGG